MLLKGLANVVPTSHISVMIDMRADNQLPLCGCFITKFPFSSLLFYLFSSLLFSSLLFYSILSPSLLFSSLSFDQSDFELFMDEEERVAFDADSSDHFEVFTDERCVCFHSNRCDVL